MPVQLRVEGGPYQELSRAEILRRVRAVFAELALGDAELSVMLTDDARIWELNREYRQKDKPTDVLAFAMREGEFGGVGGEVIGDVIVSVETARRQASEAGHDLLAEVTMLLVHGILHLLGWDHPTAAADRKMRAETARLVAIATTPLLVARAPRARKMAGRKAPVTARARTKRSPKRR